MIDQYSSAVANNSDTNQYREMIRSRALICIMFTFISLGGALIAILLGVEINGGKNG